ncbi:MAG: hypothetical protein WBW69_11735, partial [Candidatus Korobacteraceae bacterium]
AGLSSSVSQGETRAFTVRFRLPMTTSCHCERTADPSAALGMTILMRGGWVERVHPATANEPQIPRLRSG